MPHEMLHEMLAVRKSLHGKVPHEMLFCLARPKRAIQIQIAAISHPAISNLKRFGICDFRDFRRNRRIRAIWRFSWVCFRKASDLVFLGEFLVDSLVCFLRFRIRDSNLRSERAICVA